MSTFIYWSLLRSPDQSLGFMQICLWCNYRFVSLRSLVLFAGFKISFHLRLNFDLKNMSLTCLQVYLSNSLMKSFPLNLETARWGFFFHCPMTSCFWVRSFCAQHLPGQREDTDSLKSSKRKTFLDWGSSWIGGKGPFPTPITLDTCGNSALYLGVLDIWVSCVCSQGLLLLESLYYNFPDCFSLCRPLNL